MVEFANFIPSVTNVLRDTLYIKYNGLNCPISDNGCWNVNINWERITFHLLLN